MSLLARFRGVQNLTGRSLAALVLLSWLGLALQPCCAMASQALTGQGGHPATHHPTGDDCPHCPPGQGSGDSHSGNALACPTVGAPGVTVQTDISLASLPLAAPLPAPAAALRTGIGNLVPSPLERRWRPPAVPLQEQYCTHLE